MILNLNRIEMGSLLIHIQSMRSSIKNVLKKNYSKEDRKDILNDYDQVKEILKHDFELIQDEESNVNIAVSFNKKQIAVLYSFINIYIEKLSDLFKKTGSCSGENKEQMEILSEIKDKIIREAKENE